MGIGTRSHRMCKSRCRTADAKSGICPRPRRVKDQYFLVDNYVGLEQRNESGNQPVANGNPSQHRSNKLVRRRGFAIPNGVEWSEADSDQRVLVLSSVQQVVKLVQTANAALLRINEILFGAG